MSVDIKTQRNVSFGLFLVALVLFLISFSTPYWDKNGSAHYGIWLFCDGSCDALTNYRLSSYMKGVQACMCLSLASVLVAFCLYIKWFCFQKSIKALMCEAQGAMALTLVAAFFNIIGVAVFGGYDRHFAYAFGVISAMLFLLNALVNLNIVCCCDPSQKSRTGGVSNIRRLFNIKRKGGTRSPNAAATAPPAGNTQSIATGQQAVGHLPQVVPGLPNSHGHLRCPPVMALPDYLHRAQLQLIQNARNSGILVPGSVGSTTNPYPEYFGNLSQCVNYNTGQGVPLSWQVPATQAPVSIHPGGVPTTQGNENQHGPETTASAPTLADQGGAQDSNLATVDSQNDTEHNEGQGMSHHGVSSGSEMRPNTEEQGPSGQAQAQAQEKYPGLSDDGAPPTYEQATGL